VKILLWADGQFEDVLKASERCKEICGAKLDLWVVLKNFSDEDFKRASAELDIDNEKLFPLNMPYLRSEDISEEIKKYCEVVFTPDIFIDDFSKVEEAISSSFNKSVESPEIKKKLAVVSPIPPLKTGIADYIVELSEGLIAYYDIDFITVQSEWILPDSLASCPVRDIYYFKENYESYDRVMYHMGNSEFHSHMPELMAEFPGVNVLHDFYLGHLLGWMNHFGERKDTHAHAMLTSHGDAGLYSYIRKPAEDVLWDYPVNRFIFSDSKGVLVHSQYAKNLAREFYGREYEKSIRVIPQVHEIPENVDRKSSRERLGIAESDFVICSFGHVNSIKLSHTILEVWQDFIDKAGSGNLKLFFVGHCEPNEYGLAIEESAEKCGAVITGFVSDADYKDYLASADAAVQLRSRTRGETSRGVLDCMAYGLPLIANDSGSFAEICSETSILLNEDFDKSALLEAFETITKDEKYRNSLREKSLENIKNHAPEVAAGVAYEKMEELYGDNPDGYAELITGLKGCISLEKPKVQVEIAKIIDRIQSLEKSPKIYVDISALFYKDLKTGIQRVVREILRALYFDGYDKYEIVPVYIANVKGIWVYKDAKVYVKKIIEECELSWSFTERTKFQWDSSNKVDDVVEPISGDIFFGLDYEPFRVVDLQQSGIYDRWCERGVKVSFVVYDLLPLLQPKFFIPEMKTAHANWLRSIAKIADKLICISSSVADELAGWYEDNSVAYDGEIGFFHLGADISSGASSKGMPDDAEDFLAYCRYNPTFIMVGTLEPRKGHDLVFQAFERLLEEGVDANLLIVGKAGWMTEKLSKKINRSRFLGRKIFWLQGISDEYLNALYREATCLMAASVGEGFGLPLIEAAQYQKPIIARDIPVFREVAGEHAFYFDSTDAAGLAESVKEWLELYKDDKHPKSDKMPWLTWDESALQIKRHLYDFK